MHQTKHFLISGRVQGVYYRASTMDKAVALGLTGWVKNLDDGDVETVATGTDEQLEEFENWLWQGPEFAKVNQVEVNTIEFERFLTFSVHY